MSRLPLPCREGRSHFENVFYFGPWPSTSPTSWSTPSTPVPDRTALVCGDRRVTYAELEARANRLAHHLAAQGVGERDHVAIYSFNSIEFVEAMLAAFKLRAVPINVNYRYVEDELLYLLDNATRWRSSTRPSSRRWSTRCGPSSRCCVTWSPSTTAPATTGAGRRGGLRGRAGGGIARARLPDPQRRRPLHPLHRRDDRLPEGRDVAARGRVARPRRRHRLPHRRAHRRRAPDVRGRGRHRPGPRGTRAGSRSCTAPRSGPPSAGS